MDTHPDDLFPFYINQTLDEDARARLQAHLSACPECCVKLAGWERIAAAVNQLADGPVPAPPPLSPLLISGRLHRPTLRQSAHSAQALIWAQRVFISRTWLLPSIGSLVLLAALGALLLGSFSSHWARMPLFAILPMAAALVTAFLFTFDDDPSEELILAAPTSLAALLFARLTLALGVICLLGIAGSLPAALSGQAPGALLQMVAAWLGPMLLLSALTTILSLCLHPRLASGAALALWGSVLILVASESAGAPVLKFSLRWLIDPGWRTLAVQVLLAALLWLATWLRLSGDSPAPARRQGGA